MFGKKQKQEQKPARITDDWLITANGVTTTIGMQRKMAMAMATHDYDTASERGLALSLLAALDLIEDEARKQ
jgi:hypothetical protein